MDVQINQVTNSKPRPTGNSELGSVTMTVYQNSATLDIQRYKLLVAIQLCINKNRSSMNMHINPFNKP